MMILWPILFISLALAEDDYSIEEYCYSSPSRMQQVNQKSKIIFVPSDVVTMDGPCMTVKARSHRRELIQSFLRNVDPSVNIKFSSAENKRPPCNMKVEKIKQVNRQNLDIKLEQSGTVSAGQQMTEVKDVSSISTLSDFELSVNQNTIKGQCRFITPERYEITIEVRKDLTPIYPPVAVGTTPVVTTPLPDQETSKLVTTLQIEKGQRIELGSIVKDLKNKSNKVDINSTITHTEIDDTNSESVYLSLP
jgi:hypothetical protein